MKKKTYLLACLFAVSASSFAGTGHILPKPHSVTMSSGKFSLANSINVSVPDSGEFAFVATEIGKLVTENGGTLNAGLPIKVTKVTAVAGADFQEEAYKLTVTANSIDIEATTPRGAFWAVQTLWQMAENNGNAVDACTITDWPAFRLRGYMHDVGRDFIPFDELKNEILRLSRYKINTFHWHLTDNQGWRLQSEKYPKLTENGSFSRKAGQFYTKAQAKELVKFAKEHGVNIIPEIDMPGHSEAFRKAMGHSMLTEQGLTEMKAIMEEACETFGPDVEFIHIGSDEVRAADTQGSTMKDSDFVPQICTLLRSKGKKVVVWRNGHGYQASDVDMVHMWATAGSPLGNLPAIDSRYHYINHYDQYADVVSLYNSNVYHQDKGSEQFPGLIMGIWNDRATESWQDIVKQNAFYQSVLAAAERTWLGGGKGYFENIGTTLSSTDTDFADWESRFLYHKANFLKDEPIAYVKQTNVKWRITDQFPNNGNLDAVFPPEQNLSADFSNSYDYNGTTYNTTTANGATVYLRHVWGGIIPTFYSNPKENHTAYAYTYVHSPSEQTVGMQIEFQNYSRSENDLPAPQGQWDVKKSKVWVNGTEIAPPTWKNTHTSGSSEITLKNENCSAREPIQVKLNAGWNKVLLKLPNNGFSNKGGVRLVKWMYTFVFVTPDGKNAVEGLTYSPDKSLNPYMDILTDAVDEAVGAKAGVAVGDNPGMYSVATVDAFQRKIDEANALKANESLTEEQCRAAAAELVQAAKDFKAAVNMPKVSEGGKTYWYNITTKRAPNLAFSYQGSGAELKGETYAAGTDKQMWKFTRNSDGTYNIVSKSSPETYISPASDNNKPLVTRTNVPTSGGWTLKMAATSPHFAVVSGTAEMNQTNQQNKVFNWGGGTNLNDDGCQVRFRIEMIEGADEADSLAMAISDAFELLSSNPAVGDAPGDKPATLLAAMQNAYDEARALSEKAAAAQQRAAYKALNEAREAFNNSGVNMPVEGVWYKLVAVRDTRAVEYKGDGAELIGSAYAEDDRFAWQVVALADGSFSIVNKGSGAYIDTNSGKLKAVQGTKSAPGWKFNPIPGTKLFTIVSGSNQFNQGNGGTQFAINNWGGGTNTTDNGCQYTIVPIESVATGVATARVAGGFGQAKAYSVTGMPVDAAKHKGIMIIDTGAGLRKVLVK